MKHKEAYPVRYMKVMGRRGMRRAIGSSPEKRIRSAQRLSFAVCAAAAFYGIVYEYNHPQDKFLAVQAESGNCALIGVVQSHIVEPAEAVSIVARGLGQALVFDVSGQPVSLEMGAICAPEGHGSTSGVLYQADRDGVGGSLSSSVFSVSYP